MTHTVSFTLVDNPTFKKSIDLSVFILYLSKTHAINNSENRSVNNDDWVRSHVYGTISYMIRTTGTIEKTKKGTICVTI